MSLHHRIEVALGLDVNMALYMAPLFSAGIAMIWLRERARHDIENDEEKPFGDWSKAVFQGSITSAPV